MAHRASTRCEAKCTKQAGCKRAETDRMLCGTSYRSGRGTNAMRDRQGFIVHSYSMGLPPRAGKSVHSSAPCLTSVLLEQLWQMIVPQSRQ